MTAIQLPITLKGIKNVTELYEKFAPALYFHPQENAFPIGLNTLVENSALVMRMSNGDEKRLEPGTFTIDDLDNMKELWKKKGYSDEQLNGAVYSLDPDLTHDALKDTRKNKENPVVHVAPAVVNFTDDKSGKEQSYLRLTYVYVSAINNPEFPIVSTVAKLLGLAQPGYHKADIEHVAVYIPLEKQIKSDKIVYSLTDPSHVERAYYSAHGSAEGTWVKNPKVEQESHIKVYVAQGSHANYPGKGIHIPFPGIIKRLLNTIGLTFLIPETGYIPRIMGFASDRIGLDSKPHISTGTSITPMPKVIASNKQAIEFDAGNFDVGIYKDFVKGKEPPKSTNWFIRLLPLSFMKRFMKTDHQDTQVTPLAYATLQPEYGHYSTRHLSKLSHASSLRQDPIPKPLLTYSSESEGPNSPVLASENEAAIVCATNNRFM
ncbi:hypothetical protein [Legionella spiritensis]|uniref:Uncharacterized protein n=1 Tax=Legionella spiritensis TaxID=452 RepID=A0A0W0Z5J6_LEGSP|nr:hypothetical protein [Legionella spiritensis]KTD64111.1 hypothetical protein Lspi_1630 [Legionella spiritensis]SNV37881.1 Plant protein of uncharacterised function (DUF946) [Legionella spiritensis]